MNRAPSRAFSRKHDAVRRNGVDHPIESASRASGTAHTLPPRRGFWDRGRAGSRTSRCARRGPRGGDAPRRERQGRWPPRGVEALMEEVDTLARRSGGEVPVGTRSSLERLTTPRPEQASPCPSWPSEEHIARLPGAYLNHGQPNEREPEGRWGVVVSSSPSSWSGRETRAKRRRREPAGSVSWRAGSGRMPVTARSRAAAG
jgi:hypothetical protein